jgi:methyl-accepting chemotaxis protein
LPQAIPPSAGPADLASYCEEGRAQVAASAPLRAAVEAFRCSPKLRLLPVVDAAGRPIGAVFEQDVREILYNPYGHALLDNPAFNRAVETHCRPCPIADMRTPLPDLLDAYARADGSEGMILTSGGRLFGTITNRTLIRLAAEREAEIARVRLARLEQMASASDHFVRDIAALADALARVTSGVESAAAATAGRTRLYSERAAAVAAAAAQTAEGMTDLAGQGSALAGTIDRVRGHTILAREAAGEAVMLSAAASARGRMLGEAANAIEATLRIVQTIAGQSQLLAINAAIEAARLGSDGGGFAVVARELRQFAGRTRDAVVEIGDRIGEVRTVSAEVIEGQSAIDGVVHRIEDMTRSVDEAVGVQAATARLLADNVAQALGASSDINDNVLEISRMVADAAQGTVAMRTMADDLAHETARLRGRVSAFVEELRAAG